MANYVIQRPEYVGYMTTTSGYVYASGMSASAITDSKTLGSCRELSLEVSSETLEATSTNYNDAVVATAKSGYRALLTVLLEEVTSSAFALGWDMSANGTSFEVTASAQTPTNYAIIAEPFKIDGSACTGIFTKCHPQTPSRKLAKEQELIELKFDVLVDVDASAGKEWFRFIQQ